LRSDTFGQHFDFRRQGPQSSLLARYRIVRPLCTLPVVRSALPFGHLYSFFSYFKALAKGAPANRMIVLAHRSPPWLG
jgi:hypothetical protein